MPGGDACVDQWQGKSGGRRGSQVWVGLREVGCGIRGTAVNQT